MAETAEQLVVLLEAKVNDFEKNMRRAARAANDNFGGIEDRGRRMGRNLERDLASSTARINTTLGRMGQGIGANIAAIGSRAGGAIAAVLGVNELKKYADGWTEAGNKIAAAGEAAESVGARQSELADLAMRARSDFSSVVDLYTGLRRASEELGASQAQVLKVTETISKGFVVGGQSAATAAGAIVQLNQAFQSGKLSGDELNSVLEGAPPIARLIAKEFGVGVGELKKLAEAGKLTSDKVFGAVLKGAGDIEAEFAKTSSTVSQAFTNLSTAFGRYIGQADQAVGASSAVAGAIQGIANNMDVAAPAAAVLAATLLGAFVGGPIGAGIAGTTTALLAFGDAVRPISSDLATLGDYARAAFGMIGELGAEAGPKVAAGFQQAAELATAALSGIDSGDALANFLAGAKAALNALVGAFVTSVELIRASWNTLGPALGEVMVNAMNGVIATVQAAVNKVIGAVNSITGAVNAAGGKVGIDVGLGTIGNVDLGQVANTYAGAGKVAGEAYGKAFDAMQTDYVGKALDSASAGLQAFRTKANQAAAQRIFSRPTGSTDNGSLDAKLKAKPGDADGKGGKGGAEKLDDFEREVAALEKRTRALDNEREALGKSATEAAKAEATFRLLEAAKKANLPVTDELRGKVDALATAYAAAKIKLEEAERAQRGVQEAQRYFGDAMSDAVSDLLVEGRSLADVFNNLAKSLARAAIQAALMGSGPLGGLLGGGGSAGGMGGLFGMILGGLKLADGGAVRGPGTSRSDSVPAMLSDGEFVMNAASTAKHRALLEALNSGRVPHLANGGLVGRAPAIPGAGLGQGAARGGPVITIAPNVNVNAAGGTPAANADLARQTARAVEGTVRTIVMEEILTQRRPGGVLY